MGKPESEVLIVLSATNLHLFIDGANLSQKDRKEINEFLKHTMAFTSDTKNQLTWQLNAYYETKFDDGVFCWSKLARVSTS